MHTPFVNKSPHRRDSAGGWLKQRLARILARSSCTAAANSDTTAFVSLAKAIADTTHRQEAPPSPYFCTPCTYERPNNNAAGRRRRSRSASLVHISVDCTGAAAGASGRRSVHSDAALLQRCPPDRGGGVKSKRRTTGKPAPRSPSASRRHCSTYDAAWGRARRPRNAPTSAPYYSWSTSSSSSTYATDDEIAEFSSDVEEEEAETRTLFSFLSFSSDSTSEFYRTNRGGGNNNTRTTTRRRRLNSTTRRAPQRRGLTCGGPPAPADAAFQFKPLVSVEETKQHEGKKLAVGAEEEAAAAGPGMAVVKRSSNPYADFRSSMVEMVLERRIGSVERMEELLGSYLSLNSPRHHPAILAAFEDVWEAVFGEE